LTAYGWIYLFGGPATVVLGVVLLRRVRRKRKSESMAKPSSWGRVTLTPGEPRQWMYPVGHPITLRCEPESRGWVVFRWSLIVGSLLGIVGIIAAGLVSKRPGVWIWVCLFLGWIALRMRLVLVANRTGLTVDLFREAMSWAWDDGKQRSDPVVIYWRDIEAFEVEPSKDPDDIGIPPAVIVLQTPQKYPGLQEQDGKPRLPPNNLATMSGMAFEDFAVYLEEWRRWATTTAAGLPN
jgi:hypothetical protein